MRVRVSEREGERAHLRSLASLVLLEESSMTPSLMLVLNCSQNFL